MSQQLLVRPSGQLRQPEVEDLDHSEGAVADDGLSVALRRRLLLKPLCASRASLRLVPLVLRLLLFLIHTLALSEVVVGVGLTATTS